VLAAIILQVHRFCLRCGGRHLHVSFFRGVFPFNSLVLQAFILFPPPNHLVIVFMGAGMHYFKEPSEPHRSPCGLNRTLSLRALPFSPH